MKKLVMLLICLLGLSCLTVDTYVKGTTQPYIPRSQKIDFVVYLEDQDMYLWKATYYEKYTDTIQSAYFFLYAPKEKYRSKIENQNYFIKVKVKIDFFNQEIKAYPIFNFYGHNEYKIIDESELYKGRTI